MTICELKEEFVKIFGESDKEFRLFAAPGRVNLIGEHTDYNGGFVFPAAISLDTKVLVREREDREFNVAATDGFSGRSNLDHLEDSKDEKWGTYQFGVADELQKAGYQLTGCDMLFHVEVPFGSGLSSSASIEVATALALMKLAKEKKGDFSPVDLVEASKISQKAENIYVGVNCGIMDQFASAMGEEDKAIFLNCKDLSFEKTTLNLGEHKIVIANTNKKRGLGDSKYNERRSECEEGLEILKKEMPGIDCLGDISAEEYEKYSCKLEGNIKKRVEHVIYEDKRVLDAIKALENKDIEEFGKLMIESHNSLRDLYEVTGVELDTLVEEALKFKGTVGARMTGAGFGGCTVSIVKAGDVDAFIEQVGSGYYERIGYNADFYVSDAAQGARELSLEE